MSHDLVLVALHAPTDTIDRPGNTLGVTKEHDEGGIGHTVHDSLPVPSALHQPAFSQALEVVGGERLVLVQVLDDLAHAPLVLPEEEEDATACIIVQALEQAFDIHMNYITYERLFI